jgi:hypothetical protein
MQPEYLRIEPAARFLGISRAHMRALLRNHQGPPSTQLGTARPLRAFMKAREQQSAPQASSAHVDQPGA